MSTILFRRSKSKCAISRHYLSSFSKKKTIYALSSAEGRAGVAVIRVSGPSADHCLSALTRTGLPEPRKASRRNLLNPKTGDLLDDALVLRFPKPSSFTGEDVVELHVHGSNPVVMGILKTISDIDGCRPAEAGEFTERAFNNNKMNLLQVEGLVDLLHAETEAQRDQALRQMYGSVGKTLETWRQDILSCLAYTEAIIDFGDDEDDVNNSAYDNAINKVLELRDSINKHLCDDRRGEIMRRGLQVAIIGPPNAGKSSLLNKLARRPAAIVSPYAGTTRDIVQVPMNMEGYPVVFSDTAGIRETSDLVEKEGMKRAKECVGASDFQIAMFDCADIQAENIDLYNLIDSNTIVVLNKIDLMINKDKRIMDMKAKFPNVLDIRQLSCETNEGLEEFLLCLQQFINMRISIDSSYSESIITRERHRQHLKECCEHLEKFMGLTDKVEIAAEHLRLAAACLGRILGRVDVEEILDVIFSDFCIGK